MLLRLASIFALVVGFAIGQDEVPKVALRRTAPCPKGYKLVSGYCVLYECYYDYQCPKDSYRLSGRDCYDNFDDCACATTHHKEGDYCVPNANTDDSSGDDRPEECDSDFICPAPCWKGKDDRDCYYDMDDCDCNIGYKYVNGYCVENSCKYDYKCPSYSKRRDFRSCYDNFDDCYCIKGYYKFRNKCVKRYW